MNYECELETGQHLEIENDGDQTFVNFSSRGPGQQQSQGHGFTTGKWSNKPRIYRSGDDHIVRIDTTNGSRFIRVQGNRASLMESKPSLHDAEQIELKESKGTRRMIPMEPMLPMKPMRPFN